MAANLDRAESALTAVSDIAYIRGIDSSGNSVRISKADLASVLGASHSQTAIKNLASLQGKIGVYVILSSDTNIPVASGLTMLIEAHTPATHPLYTTLEAWHISNPQDRYISSLINGTIGKWYKYNIGEVG